FPQHTYELRQQFKKILATEYTATSTPIQYAAIAGFQESREMDEYLEIARKIHQIMGEYTYQTLNKIEGVRTTKPESTFYLLANFNAYSDYFLANKISNSQKFSESLIRHPYHTALVGGDSLVLERTDFSARIAFVDYDGTRAMKNYVDSPPRTSSDRIEFVKNNAPKIVDGLGMIQKYLTDIKTKTNSKITKLGIDPKGVSTL
ncbi:MAG: aminotransferase class I/II-fold pyridoxal phosphate-dependent enzyme, partial [Nitrosopumilus sp.]|nr:aminotransferase class I/II-fold pyridoxal phosphate-dependent enzyme [Nitrosopumilus sp.]